jgi:hypothetical protein
MYGGGARAFSRSYTLRYDLVHRIWNSGVNGPAGACDLAQRDEACRLFNITT